MDRPTDVVIIGAGAVGCATARCLTRRGLKPLIIEKDAIGDHASGFALGGLTPFNAYGGSLVDYPLRKLSYQLHAQLAVELREETGIDTGYQKMTHFSLAVDEQERQTLVSRQEMLSSQGFKPELIDGSTLRQHEPRFTSEVIAALRVDHTALLESYRYTLALASSAERGGTEIQHGEVKALRIEGGRVTGVQTQSATVPCSQVVVATGPWSGAAAQWIGHPVPVRPLKGQIVRLRLPGNRLEGRFTWHGNYLVTKQDGMVWTGTTEEDVGFDTRPTEGARDAILLPLVKLFPALIEAEIVQQTACLRPLTADGLPIISGVAGIDGLWIVTGGARFGILFSSAMGEIAADLVTGRRTDIDISPFSLDRFSAEPEPVGARV